MGQDHGVGKWVDRFFWAVGKVIWLAFMVGLAVLLKACDRALGLCDWPVYPFC